MMPVGTVVFSETGVGEASSSLNALMTLMVLVGGAHSLAAEVVCDVTPSVFRILGIPIRHISDGS